MKVSNGLLVLPKGEAVLLSQVAAIFTESNSINSVKDTVSFLMCSGIITSIDMGTEDAARNACAAISQLWVQERARVEDAPEWEAAARAMYAALSAHQTAGVLRGSVRERRGQSSDRSR